MMSVAFWMSAILAVICLPLGALGFAEGYYKGVMPPYVKYVSFALSLAASIASIFCSVAFMVFLHKYANFFGADKAIKGVIIVAFFGIAVAAVSLFVDRESLTIPFLVYMGAFCGSAIYLGITISRCPVEFFGYKAIISKAFMAIGAFILVFAIVVPFIQVFLYIVLAMLFYKAAQLAESPPVS